MQVNKTFARGEGVCACVRFLSPLKNGFFLGLNDCKLCVFASICGYIFIHLRLAKISVMANNVLYTLSRSFW